MVFSYLLLVILLLAMGFSFWKMPFLQDKQLANWVIPLSFGFKLLMAGAIWFIYTYYYTDRANADIYKYFDDAKALFTHSTGDWRLQLHVLTGFGSDELRFHELIKNTLHWDRDPSEAYNDNPSLIRLHFFLLYFSNGLYAMHALLFAYFSMLGSVALYHFSKRNCSLSPILLVLVIFWVPSLSFWNSGVLKEAWLFFCLGFFLYYFQQFRTRKTLQNAFYFALTCFFLLNIKPYLLLCLAPGLIYLSLDKKQVFKKKILLFIGVHASMLIGSIVLFSNRLLESIAQKQSDFISLAQETGANTLYNTLEYASWSDLTLNIPRALFAALYRPMVCEINGALTALAAIENSLFLLCLFLPILFFKKPNSVDFRFGLFALSFVLILSLILGLSTPILGALVRYKTPLIPFYLIGLLTFVDREKLKRLLKR